MIFATGGTSKVNQQTLVNFNLLIQLFELQVLKLKIVYSYKCSLVRLFVRTFVRWEWGFKINQ